MAQLYGTGYGLSRMAEGASAGYLKGQDFNENKRRFDTQSRFQQMQADIRNNQTERGLDIREQTLAAQQEQNRLAGEAETEKEKKRNQFTAFSKALEAGKGAPKGSRRQVYNNVYQALAPGEQAPPVEFGEDGKETSVTLQDGTVLAGSFDDVQQVSRVLANAPEEKYQDIIKTAIQAGKIRVSKFAKSDTENGPKPADYSRAIADIFKKYSAGGLINVLPDGTIDMQSLMAGKQSAYQIISQKAQQGDEEADRDLQLLQQYYGAVEGMLAPRKLQSPGAEFPPEPAMGAAHGAETPQQGGAMQYEATATNPQTGEKIGLVNGQWIPIQ